jgi:hypothetical protein
MWELVTEESATVFTRRLKVAGGYLYRVGRVNDDDDACIAVSFVPDVDLERYASHLRDAYNQGFKDGQEQSKELKE